MTSGQYYNVDKDFNVQTFILTFEFNSAMEMYGLKENVCLDWIDMDYPSSNAAESASSSMLLCTQNSGTNMAPP